MIFVASILMVLMLQGGAPPSAADHIRRAREFFAARNYQEAAREYKEALRTEPLNGSALFSLADIYGNFLGDEKLRDRYWNLYKASSIIAEGDVASLSGDYRTAAARYTEAAAYLPENGRLHERLGLLYRQMGMGEEALREYRTAARLEPDNVNLQFELARYLWKRGEKDAAAACIDRAAVARPWDAGLRRTAITLFEEAGERERALQHLAALSAAGAATPEEHCLLGEALLAGGKLDEAAAELRLGFTAHTSRRCVAAARTLAGMYDKKGEPSKTVEIYRQMVAAGAVSPELVNDIVLLYQRQGKLDAAVQAATRGISLYPGNAMLHNNLATLYALRKEYLRALDEYRAAVRLKPDLAEAYLDMGIICKDYLNNKTAAAEAFRRYVSLVPEGVRLPEVAELLGTPKTY